MPELKGTGLGVAAIALGALGCGRALDAADCERLLDRYTERLVLEESPGATPEQVAEKQGAARRLAQKDPRFEFGDCPRRVSRSSFECAMTAPSVDAIERCLVF